MKEREIAYEPHPVSRDRKAELIAAGYKIIDARFAPADHRPAEKVEAKPAAKPVRGKHEQKSESAE